MLTACARASSTLVAEAHPGWRGLKESSGVEARTRQRRCRGAPRLEGTESLDIQVRPKHLGGVAEAHPGWRGLKDRVPSPGIYDRAGVAEAHPGLRGLKVALIRLLA